MRRKRTRQALCAAAFCATLPYLVLKIVWLSGARVGLEDPHFGTSTSMHVLNALTVCLDLSVMALAVVFGSRRGMRAPSRLVLPPMWVGAGLLAQIPLMVALFAVHHPSDSSTTSAPPAIAGWVYAAVYADFCGLGLCLLPAFALYAAKRWPQLETNRSMRATAVWGCVVAAAAAVANLMAAALRDTLRVDGRLVVAAALMAAATGVGRFQRRGGRAAYVLGFVGTGACVAWSVYDLVLTYLPNELVQTDQISAFDTVLVFVRLGVGALLGVVLVASTESHPRVSATADGGCPAYADTRVRIN